MRQAIAGRIMAVVVSALALAGLVVAQEVTRPAPVDRTFTMQFQAAEENF